MSGDSKRAQMITEREAAAIVGLSAVTLRRNRFEGFPLPGAHKYGRTIRYARAEVEQYRDDHRIS